MNSDAFFAIGSGHKVCEDYAIAGEQGGRCYGIISDGCSSSKDTDIGSRLLVKSLQQIIPSIVGGYLVKSALISAIHVANSAAKVIGLPESSLDATLGLIIQDSRDSNIIYFAIQGDGIVVYKSKNDPTITYHIIGFHNNAPGYLSYLINQSRMETYQNNCIGYRVSERNIGNDVPLAEDWPFAPLDSYDGCFNMEEIEFVAILTDGIESFKDGHNKKSVNSIIGDFVNFKNTKGEFVQRRCRRAIKDLSAQNLVHEDDFSMACIVGG